MEAQMKRNTIHKSKGTSQDLTTINKYIEDLAGSTGEHVTIKNDVLKFINKGKSERRFG
jgi:hypothetical protein